MISIMPLASGMATRVVCRANRRQLGSCPSAELGPGVEFRNRLVTRPQSRFRHATDRFHRSFIAGRPHYSGDPEHGVTSNLASRN